MTAVFKREFRSFFTSPVGYVVLAVLFCFSGYFFFVYNFAQKANTISKCFILIEINFLVFVHNLFAPIKTTALSRESINNFVFTTIFYISFELAYGRYKVARVRSSVITHHQNVHVFHCNHPPLFAIL